MTSNLLETQVSDILRSVLGDADGPVLVVDPSADVLEALISAAADSSTSFPTVRVLASEALLKDLMDDFVVASRAADLVDDGDIALRTFDDGVENTLLVTDEQVVALVTAGERVAGLTTADEEFVASALETYSTAFAESDPFALRTPPISTVRETLSDEIGESVREDFDAMLEASDGGEGLDEVTICLLVAAKNEVLLYDISKWGEDVGIASKATFSRTKSRLEDAGLIDTEKVPIDVGRPRLRLKLGEETAGANETPAALVESASARLA